MASAGDVNGDGEDDLLLPQLAGSPGADGQVFVISGETGELVDTLVAPDPDLDAKPATSTTRLDNEANFGFPWVSKVGNNRGAPGSFTDLASCPGGGTGADDLCALTAIGPSDGVPEIVVGARGVDARGIVDAGRVYVFDGATRALLKRIDQPVEDVTPVALTPDGGTWFGRTALNPAGMPACAGNFGVGDCPTGVPRAVEIGDMDAGGRPDLVIGASLTGENQASAAPDSHCARIEGAVCQSSGRVYIYRGEDIVGSSPDEVLDNAGPDESVRKIRNPFSQADNPQASVNADSEIFGNSLTAIGDVGKCNAALAPGERCPRASSTATPDGVPDVVASGNRIDYPVDNPSGALPDVGAAFLIDGATGTILADYQHPDPQPGVTFSAAADSHEPAAGDLGDTLLPDFVIPSGGQNTQVTAGGRGYVANGNFKTSTGSQIFARLEDPTPTRGAGFGPATVGVGNLVGGVENPANELLIGESGPRGATVRESVINDVHFFNAFTERALQTIPDPDQQGGSAFGSTITPLGDLNEDGFLDFSVGAQLFTGAAGIAEGRVYIFRSDNSPAPVPPAPGPSPSAPSPSPGRNVSPGPARLLAGRCANRRTGTNRRDVINGTKAGDELFGFGGGDVIAARSGPDCVDAGSGADRLAGGAGNDSLLGQSGNDRMSGRSGNDRLFGGDGRDLLSGGAGRDLLVGGDGNDRLDAGSGSHNRLFGEGGNDRIVAGSGGHDTIDAGSGRDSITATNGRRDNVDCGSGRDIARVDRFDRVRDCERLRRVGRRSRRGK